MSSNHDGNGDKPSLAVWDPVAQIYTGGPLPGCDDELIFNMDVLYVFGYGSLCWNPAGSLQTVVCRGWAKDHCRVWAQKSTDHRGVPAFPGIVCTLLTAAEYQKVMTTATSIESDGAKDVVANDGESARTKDNGHHKGVLGVIYSVPHEKIRECLEELDFREKGVRGYAREIIQVVRDDTGESVPCLLYRGTVENPAFWPRAARDLSFAASVIAVASGPSGDNHVYLSQLAEFLQAHHGGGGASENDDTLALWDLVREYRTSRTLHFMTVCGSNQHGQLRIPSPGDDEDDAHAWTEAALHLSPPAAVHDVYAGGGHSAVKTEDGRLYLWGWNDQSQLGDDKDHSTTLLSPLQGVHVESAALGFAHTMVIQKNTRLLLGFGDNRRGQLLSHTETKVVKTPTTPSSLKNDRIQHVAAGVFHSAVATETGHVVVLGGGDVTPYRWKPSDATIIKVACGARQWTVALDNEGRLWASGRDNKYGQLGRRECANHSEFHLIQGLPDGMRCLDVQCGWSHAITLMEETVTGTRSVYGWGRNDRGQLGTGTQCHHILDPVPLVSQISPRLICCGSESTLVLSESGEIWCCGWNEHGNLGWQPPELETCSLDWRVSDPGPTAPGLGLPIAAGGAHVLVLRQTALRSDR